jgi:hypothetical protein
VITAPGRTRRRRAPERAEAARTLCAIVRCGSIAVAIPAEEVALIALAEDASVEQRAGGLRITVGALAAPGWSLADLLELDAPVSSWLFLRSPGDPTALVALGCGECLTVQKLADPDALPRGVFRAGASAIERARGIIGAFRVEDALQQRGCGIAGIWVDPVRLIAAARGEM